jgi:hypothetical protein
MKETAGLILDRIILDALKYHISNAQDTQTMQQLYYMKDNNEGTRIIIDRLQSSIASIEEHNPYLNRFTDKEGAALLSSICVMLEVPKKVVEDYISQANVSLKISDGSLLGDLGIKPREGPEAYFTDGIMCWDPQKKAIRISNRILLILHEMLKKSF